VDKRTGVNINVSFDKLTEIPIEELVKFLRIFQVKEQAERLARAAVGRPTEGCSHELTELCTIIFGLS
jgi:hypothetical protein